MAERRTAYTRPNFAGSPVTLPATRGMLSITVDRLMRLPELRKTLYLTVAKTNDRSIVYVQAPWPELPQGCHPSTMGTLGILGQEGSGNTPFD